MRFLRHAFLPLLVIGLAACGGRSGLEVEIFVDKTAIQLYAGVDYDQIRLVVIDGELERSHTAEVTAESEQPFRFYVFADETFRPRVRLFVELHNSRHSGDRPTMVKNLYPVEPFEITKGEIGTVQLTIEQ